MMPCYVANSGHDERGKWNYGAAGDQTGTEWYIIPWYWFGQNAVLRHPNSIVRAKMAELARQAADNDHIGYDQSNRLSFFNELAKCKWQPKNIKTDVESDCSAGVCAIAYATGVLLDVPELKNISPSGYTGNMVSMFKRAGFEVLRGSEYLANGNKLLTGDININENQHTNIVVQGGNPAGADLIIDGWIGKYTVRELQRQLGTYTDGVIEGQYIGNIKYLERLESVEWQCTGSPCIRKLQMRIGASVDGIAGRETVTKLQRYINQRSNENLIEDGYLGNWTACALQRSLNKGMFE